MEEELRVLVQHVDVVINQPNMITVYVHDVCIVLDALDQFLICS